RDFAVAMRNQLFELFFFLFEVRGLFAQHFGDRSRAGDLDQALERFRLEMTELRFELGSEPLFLDSFGQRLYGLGVRLLLVVRRLLLVARRLLLVARRLLLVMSFAVRGCARAGWLRFRFCCFGSRSGECSLPDASIRVHTVSCLPDFDLVPV